MIAPAATGCDFCDIASGHADAREVLRTDTVVAFFPLEPATLGHTLVVPREHVPDIWSLDDATAHALADAALEIARALRRSVPLDGLNVIQSNGTAAGQSVFHLHVHVVPRRFGDAMGRIWPAESSWSETAKAEAQARLTEALHHGRHGEDA